MVKKNKKKNGNKNGRPRREPTTKIGRTSRQPRPSKTSGLRAPLSACARKYAKVLEDPFSGATACVPTLTNFPTMKHSCRVRGTFITGTAGVGYVTFSPGRAMYNDTVGAFATDGTFAGTTVTNGAGGGTIAYNTNSTYSSVMSSNQIKARVVGAGLRVRNVTALLNRGGGLCAAETLNHVNTTGFDYSTLLAMDTADTLDGTLGTWQSVVWHPQDEDEFDYYSAAALTPTDMSFYTLAFICNAPSAATVQTYEFEGYVAFEAKGTAVHGLTPSDSDPAGLAHVQNAVMSVEHRKPTSDSTAWRAANVVLKAARLAYSVYTFTARPSLPSPSRPMLTGGSGPIIEEVA